jgi:hypothetical protein
LSIIRLASEDWSLWSYKNTTLSVPQPQPSNT